MTPWAAGTKVHSNTTAAKPRRTKNAGKRVEIEQWLNEHGVEWTYRPAVALDEFDNEKSLRNQARVFTILDETVVDNYVEAVKRGDAVDTNMSSRPTLLEQAVHRAVELDRAAADRGWQHSPASAWRVSLLSQRAFLNRYASSSTAVSYAGDLADLNAFAATAGWPPLLLTRPLLEHYVAQHLLRERALAASTVRRRCAALRGWLTWSVQQGLLERSPAQNLPLPRSVPAPPRLRLTAAETAALLEAAGDADDARAAVLVLLMLGHGCRIGEVLGADVPAGVSPVSTTTRAVLDIRAKGGVPRRVLLSGPVVDAIRKACAGRSGGPLLLGTAGGRLGRSSAVRLLRDAAGPVLGVNRAGCLHPHALRRAFAAELVRRAVPVRDLQHALGHASAAQSLAYTDLERHHGEVVLSLLPGPG